MLWRILDKLVPGAFIRSRWRVLNDVYLFFKKKVYWQEERAQERWRWLYRALGDRGFAYRGRWQWAVMDWLAARAGL